MLNIVFDFELTSRDPLDPGVKSMQVHRTVVVDINAIETFGCVTCDKLVPCMRCHMMQSPGAVVVSM